MAQPQTGLELFHAGNRVPDSGEYCVVDSEGNPADFDFILLKEGDIFPLLAKSNLFYRLNDTCVDESDELIGTLEMG